MFYYNEYGVISKSKFKYYPFSLYGYSKVYENPDEVIQEFNEASLTEKIKPEENKEFGKLFIPMKE